MSILNHTFINSAYYIFYFHLLYTTMRNFSDKLAVNSYYPTLYSTHQFSSDRDSRQSIKPLARLSFIPDSENNEVIFLF